MAVLVHRALDGEHSKPGLALHLVQGEPGRPSEEVPGGEPGVFPDLQVVEREGAAPHGAQASASSRSIKSASGIAVVVSESGNGSRPGWTTNRSATPRSEAAISKPLAALGAALRFTSIAHSRAVGQKQQQVDLRARAGAIEPGVGPEGRSGDQVLDDEPFPTRPHHRMREHVIEGSQAQQRMQRPRCRGCTPWES